MNADIQWLIIEDSPGIILNWLAVLKDKGIQGADLLYRAIAPCSVVTRLDNPRSSPFHEYFLNNPLCGKEGGISFIPPDGCEILELSNKKFGIKVGKLVVLFVSDENAAKSIGVWLENRGNLPSSCISFLDWQLIPEERDDITHNRYKAFVELLGKHPSQLCISHSCHERTPYPNPFFKIANSPLLSRATDCVNHAIKWWSDVHGVFTNDREVDSILSMFALGKSDNWDVEIGGGRRHGPFYHDTLEIASSRSRRYIGVLGDGSLSKISDRCLKGLFLCDPGVVRDERSIRPVSSCSLQKALDLIKLNRVKIEEADWVPPFSPGILFLCQLKLLMKEFDTNGQAPPKKLLFAPRLATFVFDDPIENMEKIWETHTGNVSTAMREVRSGYVGKKGERWTNDTICACIIDLLQPDNPNNNHKYAFKFPPGTNTLKISW